MLLYKIIQDAKPSKFDKFMFMKYINHIKEVDNRRRMIKIGTNQ